MRLMLQPDCSIQMSTVKVKLAIIENICLWMLCTWKERGGGGGFVLSIRLFLLVYCLCIISSFQTSVTRSKSFVNFDYFLEWKWIRMMGQFK